MLNKIATLGTKVTVTIIVNESLPVSFLQVIGHGSRLAFTSVHLYVCTSATSVAFTVLNG